MWCINITKFNFKEKYSTNIFIFGYFVGVSQVYLCIGTNIMQIINCSFNVKVAPFTKNQIKIIQKISLDILWKNGNISQKIMSSVFLYTQNG